MKVVINTDPIADMLSRIRNAIAVHKSQVYVPYSKIKESIASQLVKSGFISKVKTEGSGVDQLLLITINDTMSVSRISEIKRLSTPGRRLYSPAEKIPIVKRGRGIVIISTSSGVMTGTEAKAKSLGGELICSVY